MFFSFICYALYAFLAFQAYGIVSAEGLTGEALKAAQAEAYNYLYAGSIILGLGNGTVEAFINPVVATMFSKDKTKWLNILHAGWPGGLVVGGILTIMLGQQAAEDWRILIYLIAIPGDHLSGHALQGSLSSKRASFFWNNLSGDARRIRSYRSSHCKLLDL